VLSVLIDVGCQKLALIFSIDGYFVVPKVDGVIDPSWGLVNHDGLIRLLFDGEEFSEAPDSALEGEVFII
jgi:hypothetical protein